MEKLVRDKMPELCAAKAGTGGWTPMTHRIASKEEIMGFLLEKLVEEAKEARAAGNHFGLIAELADVREVIMGIQFHANIAYGAIDAAREHKFDERGGFLNGVIWDGKY